jgi:pyridoxamine 5'-phosphate oxidase
LDPVPDDDGVMMSTPAELARMRREYRPSPLLEADLAGDWPTQFGRWFAEAVAFGLPEPNAMVVATAGADGRPSARTVLLKDYDRRGLTFFTNYQSRKGRELTANPAVSLVFPWFVMHRQVVICGAAERIDRQETETYFGMRPRDSQIGAWASPQSQVMADRKMLDDAYAEAAANFDDGIPAPPHWGGFRVSPETVEFWQGRPSRMHDRLQYRKMGDAWVVERLAP